MLLVGTAFPSRYRSGIGAAEISGTPRCQSPTGPNGDEGTSVVARRCQPRAVSSTAATGYESGTIAASADRHGPSECRLAVGGRGASGSAAESGKMVLPSIEAESRGARQVR